MTRAFAAGLRACQEEEPLQFNLRIAACCLAALCIDVTHAQAPTNAPDEVAGPPAPAAEAEPGADAITLDPILIRERRPQDIGPMPGLGLTKEEIPSNVQSITAKDIRDSNSLSLTDLMNSQMQSVTVNDYQGNPFQVDVQFRGFTAGPQVGTPQGLSVFLDGIRMNEPFGDVMNWDMIPMNALSRFDVFPGSNPLFGLNTLGGALSMRTKSGFTDPGVEAKYLGGSWGRNQVQLSGGGSVGPVAGFVALQGFAEDGWRDNSPSKLRQLFIKNEISLGNLLLGFSALKVDSELVGNGLIPLEDYERRPGSVFSSPDETRNELNQYQWSAMFEVNDSFNITAMAYRRNSSRSGFNGDVLEDGFEDLDEGSSLAPGISSDYSPYCAYADTDEDGVADSLVPLNPSCDPPGSPSNSNIVGNGTTRNGANTIGNPNAPGVVNGTPIAVATRTLVAQEGDGAALQLNWNLERHKLMLGASLDTSRTLYNSTQRLGLLDADRRFYYATYGFGYNQIDPRFYAAENEITVNDFSGKSTTKSLYFSETWTPRDDLHLSLSARYNLSHVNNWMTSRSSTGDLTDFVNRQPGLPYILCWGTYPDECDQVPTWTMYDPDNVRRTATLEKHTYRSFNPSAGVSWLPRDNLNLFANYSRGARVPSTIELGCAMDHRILISPQGNPYPAARTAPPCYLPNTLSGDPYLPQIRSHSYEIGARGTLDNGFEWNVTAYRTDLSNDIYLVGVSAIRSYFDTIGRTRRQGLEMGLKGKIDKWDFRANYAFTRATFESSFYMYSPHNSSSDVDGNSAPGAHFPNENQALNNGFGTFQMIRIDPGDTMPGAPRHNFNLTLGYQFNDNLNFKLGMVAHSPTFVRGNENNDHEGAGNDGIIQGYSCSPNPAPCATPNSGGTKLPGRDYRYSGKLPGFAIFNFSASYKIDQRWTALLQINNLLDKDYFTAGRLGITPFAPSVRGAIGESGWNYNSADWLNTTMVAPGAPRAIWVGMSLRLD